MRTHPRSSLKMQNLRRSRREWTRSRSLSPHKKPCCKRSWSKTIKNVLRISLRLKRKSRERVSSNLRLNMTLLRSPISFLLCNTSFWLNGIEVESHFFRAKYQVLTLKRQIYSLNSTVMWCDSSNNLNNIDRRLQRLLALYKRRCRRQKGSLMLTVVNLKRNKVKKKATVRYKKSNRLLILRASMYLQKNSSSNDFLYFSSTIKTIAVTSYGQHRRISKLTSYWKCLNWMYGVVKKQTNNLVNVGPCR